LVKLVQRLSFKKVYLPIEPPIKSTKLAGIVILITAKIMHLFGTAEIGALFILQMD
jgi:hypothetical protein